MSNTNILPSNQNRYVAFYLGIMFIIVFIFLFIIPKNSYSQLASGQSKFVGNIVSNGFSVRSDFSEYWNQVTPENAGKWGSVEFSPGVYNWTQLDDIYNYALSKGFPYKHHNLIWGQQQPNFLNNLDSVALDTEIVNWIKMTGQRYPKADFCDVVNEPIHTPPFYKNVLGGNGATGWDWVIKAFELARQYWSPHTKLLINEYSVLNNAATNAEYIQIINLLKERGLIDGIGVEAHYFSIDAGAPLSTLKTNLDRLTATGLPVYISEFDINQHDDDVQLQRYQTIFPMLYEDPGVYGVTIWGYVEGETWVPYSYLVSTRGAERPALQWLRTYLATPNPPVLVSPIENSFAPRNATLNWRSSAFATSYTVQVSTDSIFSSIVADSSVTDTLFQLNPLTADTRYYWRVEAVNKSSASGYSDTASFTTGDQIVSVAESTEIPQEFSLSQNYPNPFNPSTMISYQLPMNSPQDGVHKVTLKVFDILGQEVKTLVDEYQNAGFHSILFTLNSSLSSGTYIYQLRAGNFISTKKMIVIK